MIDGGSPWSVLALTVMPGAVTVNAGNTNNAILGANALKLFALPLNSKVFFTFQGTRVNSAAGGSGAYQLRVDGVNVAPVQTFAGNLRGALLVSQRMLLGPGDHTIELSMTAAVGDETVHDSGQLFAFGSVGT